MAQAVNIVIPMAGEGKRFQAAGYTIPKPFIDILGTTMIERVLDNLNFDAARYILIARRDHIAQCADTVARIRNKYNLEIRVIDKLTEGAVCTVLHAASLINTATPLIISNCDELIDISLSDLLSDATRRQLDGLIVTFHAHDTKWSFVKIDDAGYATEVKEKQVISHHATAGLYYSAHGSSFINAAAEMIAHNDRTNNEFYVAPTYNYLLRQGGKVGIYEINAAQMHGLGTPEDVAQFLIQAKHALPVSQAF